MQIYDLSVSSLISTLIAGRKFLLKYVITFVIIGCLVAFFYSEKLATTDTGSADKLPAPVFSDSEDVDILSKIQEVTDYCFYANEYVKAMIGSNQLSESQYEELNGYTDTINKFVEENVADVTEAYNDLPLYISREGIAKQYTEIEDSISETNQNLMKAEEAALLIEKMGAVPIGNENLENTYSNILNRAVGIADYKIKLEILQEQLTALDENSGELFANSREIDNMVEELYQEADELNDQLYAAADQIATKNHLILKVAESDDTVTITLSHGYSASSASEVFQLIVVFFILTGICSGALITICNEAKKKNLTAKQSEA